ncbi:DoxX family membrane protein [Mucilaginibacter sp. OK098]|uniref:DoxX family membrane protein n=1 Tax=Mucilaginibacter sp. OK098 TaxID=1855297 RepID=UPI002100BE13|nr:DoxX family membrane protein [Mucilaginibacter sp. OK098]
MAGFEKFLTRLMVRFPHLTAWLSSLIEVFGGLAILSGLFVSIMAIPLIYTMLVTMLSPIL